MESLHANLWFRAWSSMKLSFFCTYWPHPLVWPHRSCMASRSRSGRRTGSSFPSSSLHCWRRDWQPAMAFRFSTPNQEVSPNPHYTHTVTFYRNGCLALLNILCLHDFQVSQQEEGEWETHPSVYCTALIWGEGEGRFLPLPRWTAPTPYVFVHSGREGGRVGGRDGGTPLD